jgi:preprotein translocase subunit YajC
MEYGWILAQAGPNEVIIKAEDISKETSTQTTVATQADSNSAAAPAPKGKSPGQMQSFIFIGLLIVLMYFMVFRGPKKQRQQQQQMVRALKKNDRVQTIGGIFGTVLEVSDTEITLKIDESNNTKIKVIPSAINRVIEQK